MGIIEDLWYGDVAPYERDIKHGSEYEDALKRIVQFEEDLYNRLNEEEQEIFEKFVSCSNEICSIAERETFVRGFALGIKLIIEVMSAENE